MVGSHGEGPVQPATKADLREIWTAPDRATTEAAITVLAKKHGAKYDKAVTCLTKDRDALRTFCGFRPALGPPTHVQPDRERVRDRAAPHCAPEARCRRTPPG